MTSLVYGERRQTKSRNEWKLARGIWNRVAAVSRNEIEMENKGAAGVIKLLGDNRKLICMSDEGQSTYSGTLVCILLRDPSINRERVR